jgi:polyhydroxyalkanoate synthase
VRREPSRDDWGSLRIDVDDARFGSALAAVARDLAKRPDVVAGLAAHGFVDAIRIGSAILPRLFGSKTEPPIAPEPADRRFVDPAWMDNPVYFMMWQYYLAAVGLLDQGVSSVQVDPVTAAKARIALRFVTDALAPTNGVLTNPAVLRRALETGGASLFAGLRNLVDDVVHNKGRPRQVDRTQFRVGENLAATPAKVVYRSELIELLQYEPQTNQVHATPILMSPPWINKYYIMDLAPQRSFIEWAVQRGHTVFAISYRNPDASMSGVQLDDYLLYGPKAALDVISDITGATKVNIVGLCLGGTMAVMTAAHLTASGDQRINTITLLNTLVDFREPGVLGAFTDEETVARLERRMAKTGFHEGAAMSTTFDLLRSNDLIFNYVVSNWLLGQDPPAFDILAWNADKTRLPAAMHSFYLRSCYLENRLAQGTMKLADRSLHLEDVTTDAYIVAATNDHIVPWESSYSTTQLLPGRVRFVLSSGGHIAGIVSPPSPAAWHMTARALPQRAQEWRNSAVRRQGSWWEDWARWIAPRAGAKVPSPPLGSSRYPVLGDGPGQYVHG